eukprot:TRINITY_DN23188_c0_g1_i4.p2 TRINITY_DN23188_c0_g1~~TRINITY_DN23188_c0_g1_i4.p2  ORF type:complete len:122 (-),score=40.66 TRINITY_DN23188_c0_g1_i4:227-592(-)
MIFVIAETTTQGVFYFFFFFQAEDGIRDVERSRGLGDVYKRQGINAEYMGKIIMNEEDDGFAELELDRKAAMEELVKAAKLQVPQVPDDKPKFTRRRGILIPKCQLEQTRKKFAEDLKSEH